MELSSKLNLNLLNNILKCPQPNSIDFYEPQADKFYFFSGVLAILKNKLELEEWTNGIKSSAREPIGNDEGRNEM